MYSAPTAQDSKVMRTLLRDAAKFPNDARWSSLQEFNAALGPRPEKANLLKRNTRTGHGPGNSYWITDKPTEEELSQAKATRKAERGKKVRDQHPTTKKAVKALLAAIPKPVYPTFRVRTAQEQDEQVLLLYQALSPPDDGAYY